MDFSQVPAVYFLGPKTGFDLTHEVQANTYIHLHFLGALKGKTNAHNLNNNKVKVIQ
jgi:hypothetical protein